MLPSHQNGAFERLQWQLSRTVAHGRDERGRQVPLETPSSYGLFSTAPGPKQEDCEPGAGLIQPQPVSSTQTSSILVIRMSLALLVVGSFLSHEKRTRAIGVRSGQRVGPRHARPPCWRTARGSGPRLRRAFDLRCARRPA